jgi:hypothetical protein
MVHIAGQTLTSAGSITFSSIPQTFTHLQLRLSNGFASAATVFFIGVQVNGDTGANYAYHRLWGNGSGAASNGGSSNDFGFMIYGGANVVVSTATNPSIGIMDILDYTNTNKNKTSRSIYGQDANGSGETGLASGLWLSTAAITSLRVYGYGNNLATGTRVDLYGITTSQVTGA